MIINLPFVRIEVTLQTRKARVLRDLKEVGMIETIKRYKARYKCDLKSAYDFIKSLESEGKHANPNQ